MPTSARKHWTHPLQSRRHRDQPRGFTLIEMALVIVILGIVTAGATLTLLPRLQTANATALMERLAECDERARSLARRNKQGAQLVFDPNAGTVSLQEEGLPERELLKLPSQVSLNNVVTEKGAQTGRYSVRYGQGGRSESYAIGVRNGSDEPRWIVFAGMTGQHRQGRNGRQVEALFETISGTRTDAD